VLLPMKPPLLARQQAEFARSLLWREDGIPKDVISHTARMPVKRFCVYRNNVFAGLIDALQSRFPVVARLVGEVFFRAMARAFVGRHPPRSTALLEYGEDFPAFLATFEPAAHLPYLADVARLEWLRCRAYHAADARPLTVSELLMVPTEQLGAVRVTLHPSVGLASSGYPVVSIWQTNTYDDKVQPVGSDMPGEDALVVRPRLDVLVVPLGPGGLAFASSLARGETMADAAQCALDAAPEFALESVLGSLVRIGAIGDLSLNGALLRKE